MKPLLAALAAATVLVAWACDGGGDGPRRSIDVRSLTHEEVRARALAAVGRPGQVLHVTSTTGERGEEQTIAAWLDLERDLARVERDDELSVYHDGLIAMLSPLDRSFQEAAITPGEVEKTSLYALKYLVRLLTAKITGVREAEVEGAAAIRVDREQEYGGDARGTVTAKLYLDESFLPLREEYHADLEDVPDIDYTTRFAYEFVARESLAPDFFSAEAVRARALTPAGHVAAAAKTGFPTYWLGERFDEMILKRALLSDLDATGDGQERTMNLEYAPAEGVEPDPCLHLSVYTSGAWSKLQEARRRNSPAYERDRIERAAIDVDGGRGFVYEIPGAVPPGPSRTGTAVPGGAVSGWSAVLEAADAVVEVSPTCGPAGRNVYLSAEALVRVLRALRPFEAAGG